MVQGCQIPPGGSLQGVPAQTGPGHMGALAGDGKGYLGGAAHHPAGHGGEDSCRKVRPQVQAENGSRAILGEDPGFANGPGSAGGLLGRLEDQKHVVGDAAPPGQTPGQLQGNGHMAVVAAGVHPAGVARGKGQSRLLGHWQGVHIRPKGQAVILSKIKEGA